MFFERPDGEDLLIPPHEMFVVEPGMRFYLTPKYITGG